MLYTGLEIKEGPWGDKLNKARLRLPNTDYYHPAAHYDWFDLNPRTANFKNIVDPNFVAAYKIHYFYPNTGSHTNEALFSCIHFSHLRSMIRQRDLQPGDGNLRPGGVRNVWWWILNKTVSTGSFDFERD